MSDNQIRVVTEDSCRIVTPSDPLIINATPANFPCIDIQGGFIQTKVAAVVKIDQLTKSS